MNSMVSRTSFRLPDEVCSLVETSVIEACLHVDVWVPTTTLWTCPYHWDRDPKPPLPSVFHELLPGILAKCKNGAFCVLCTETIAIAKSLQSCPTLCDPIDGSPPGSPVPGILPARTLKWVAISFSSAWKRKVKVKLLSRPHGLQPTRLFHPWDFPGKSTGMGCHCLLHVQKILGVKGKFVQILLQDFA